MKFVTLKSFNKNKIIISTLIITSLILVVTLFVSHAEFTSTDHVTIVDGVINYTPYDFKMMAMYEQKENCEDPNSDACYTEIGKMPSEGYSINQDKSYCFVDNDTEHLTDITLKTNNKGEHVIGNLPKRSKCIIYFEKSTTKKVEVSGLTLTVNLDGAHFDGTSCSNGCKYQENGIYEAPDENGTTSYYFRGSVENNYVKFGKDKSQADIWWRIIRINGDGSIRMIYAGTSTNGSAPIQTGAITAIGKYSFNSNFEGDCYVGYQYTEGKRNGHTTDSNAKTELEKWFAENLMEEYNAGYIDKNIGFCGDRSVADEVDGMTYYSPWRRTGSTHEPTFLCEDEENDLYTVNGAKKGTKSLEYPIGLSTVDEQVYAGAADGIRNEEYYLYSGEDYWTMSPTSYSLASDAERDDYFETYIYSVTTKGLEGFDRVSFHLGLRPVINLVAGSLTSGDGTAGNPYRIS